MIRTLLGAVLLLLAMAIAPQANAASFDCAKAATAFEHAICDNPKLSAQDDVLAVEFATAAGGLDKAATATLRDEQRDWLDFAAASCTDTAKPLADGARYTTSDQLDCLGEAYSDRIQVLETSRMVGGHRFAVSSAYSALPDPDAASDPEYYWKVASHAVSYPVLQGKDADGFNTAVAAAVKDSDSSLDADGQENTDAQSDSTVVINFDEVVSNRVSLKISTYWFGHGAAHGEYALNYLHYRLDTNALVQASDLFTGTTWKKTLTTLALGALNHDYSADDLQLDNGTDIAAIVTDPSRWSFTNESGLTIQFQPYEVAAYAMGAPTIVIPWGALSDILAESADAVRYGT